MEENIQKNFTFPVRIANFPLTVGEKNGKIKQNGQQTQFARPPIIDYPKRRK
ncbi:hypothetical protein [uncultured Neglectibacter sp.]|uniref:hypothetical protein n=1 Tax=uncultured Neglectibacter sp. TaxID=1924108 RepID=UPI0034DFD21F